MPFSNSNNRQPIQSGGDLLELNNPEEKTKTRTSKLKGHVKRKGRIRRKSRMLQYSLGIAKKHLAPFFAHKTPVFRPWFFTRLPLPLHSLSLLFLYFNSLTFPCSTSLINPNFTNSSFDRSCCAQLCYVVVPVFTRSF